MDNMREYWAREAEMMRDTSAVLGERVDNTGGNGKSFSVNIIEAVNTLHRNGVIFGLNRIRNVKGSGKYDPVFWSIINDTSLRLNNGKTSAQGIQSILSNSYKHWTFDCAQYVQVVYLGACLLTDGAKQFNLYITNLLQAKKLKTFNLYPHGTVGVESKEFYVRGVVNGAFRLDTDTDLYSKGKTEQEVLRLAPIGSRVTVSNFYLNDLLASKDKAKIDYAQAISLRGWAYENMIKIGNDSYAAFGIGTNVSLEKVKQELLKEHYYKVLPLPTQTEKDAVMKYIGISQVKIYQRS
jgi:Protein-glutamine gamma-glutamyltransferase